MRLFHGFAACALLACALPAGNAAAGTAAVDATATEEPVEVAPGDAAAVQARCQARIDTVQATRTALLALPPQTEPTVLLRAFDALYALASEDGFEAHLLSQVHPDAALRAAASACHQRLAHAWIDLYASPDIHRRLAAIDAAGLVPELRHMLARQLQSFRRSGADRDAATAARVAALQRQILDDTLAFKRNIDRDVRFLEAKREQREGLPPDFLARYANASGSLRFPVDETTAPVVRSYAHDARLRRSVTAAALNRAYPANQRVLQRLIARRGQLARMLGHGNYAEYDFASRMAATPDNVLAFLDSVAGAARPSAEHDAAQLLARLRRDDASVRSLQTADAAYAFALLGQEQQADPRRIRQFLAYDPVQAGVLALAEDLFDVEIRPWPTATWAPQVQAFEMREHGRVIGRFYIDAHPRAGKSSGNLMLPVRIGVRGRSLPVAALITNLPDGPMEHAQLATLLHEFGHLLHWLFSGQQDWAMHNFHELEHDAREVPSQLLEEWAWDYDTLQRFARDAQGRPIPQQLVARMNAGRDFGRGLQTLQQLALARVSLAYHTRGTARADLGALYLQTTAPYAISRLPAKAHPYAGIAHLGNQYGAAYYTYLWSQALATDLLTRFRAHGLHDRATAQAYRRAVLQPGGSAPMDVLAADFLGRPWTSAPYLASLQEAPEPAVSQ